MKGTSRKGQRHPIYDKSKRDRWFEYWRTHDYCVEKTASHFGVSHRTIAKWRDRDGWYQRDDDVNQIAVQVGNKRLAREQAKQAEIVREYFKAIIIEYAIQLRRAAKLPKEEGLPRGIKASPKVANQVFDLLDKMLGKMPSDFAAGFLTGQAVERDNFKCSPQLERFLEKLDAADPKLIGDIGNAAATEDRTGLSKGDN